MHSQRLAALLPLLSLLVLVALACAGSTEAPPSSLAGGDAALDGVYSGGSSVIPSTEGDGGAGGGGGYGYGQADGSPGSPCPRDSGDAAAPTLDASSTRDSGIDVDLVDGSEAGEDAYACPSKVGPGDLIIDELMIASAPGSSDHGEWIEVASTRDCAIDLNGLFAELPHGSSMTTAAITSDAWLPPRGFFLIADSAMPMENHLLPGLVFVWGSGTLSDVLRNSGNTITLYTASATVDTFTYPTSSKLVDGASMAFPSDCASDLRAEFGNWQPSIASWTPGFFGTPGAPNRDVSCPVLPPAPKTPCGG
jgi:hypothetical protein